MGIRAESLITKRAGEDAVVSARIPKVIQGLSDGSAVTEQTVRYPNGKLLGGAGVREVGARVEGKGGSATERRLRTSLVEGETYSAQELIGF